MLLKSTSKTLYIAFQQHKTSLQRVTSIATATRGLCSTPYLHKAPFVHIFGFCKNTSIFDENKNFYGQRKMGSMQIRAMSGDSFGSVSEEGVKETISENPVVVYSKTSCPFSGEVKSLFRKLGVDAHVVELDKLGPDGPELQEILEKLTGQRTVPNVFIGGKHIGGCSDTLALHQKGELETLLSEADAL